MNILNRLSSLKHVGAVPGLGTHVFRSGGAFLIFDIDTEACEGTFSTISLKTVKAIWRNLSGISQADFSTPPRIEGSPATAKGEWRGAIMVLLAVGGARHLPTGKKRGLQIGVEPYRPAALKP